MYKLIAYNRVVFKINFSRNTRVFIHLSIRWVFVKIGIQEMSISLVLKHQISIRDIVDQS